jgi:hypothetical protein
LGNSGQFKTKLDQSYIHVFIEDEGEDWPKGEDRGVAQLQIGVENRNGDVIEYARKDDLNDRNNEAPVDDEVDQK